MASNPDLTYNLDGSLDMRCKKNKEWIAKQNKKIGKNKKIGRQPHMSNKPITLLHQEARHEANKNLLHKEARHEANKNLLLPGGQRMYFMR